MTPADEVKRLALHLHTPPVANRLAGKVLEAALSISDEERSDEREPGIHPSALAVCRRKAWMELKNAPRVDRAPAIVRRAGYLGTSLHRTYQKAFAVAANKCGYRFKAEVSLESKKHKDAVRLALKGHADGEFSFHGVTLGLEIKSVSSDIGKDPLEIHLLQAAVYQHCLNWDATWFIYVSRKTTVSRNLIIRIDDAYWKTMADYADIVIDNELRDLAPAGTNNVQDCRICSYLTCCPDPKDIPVPATEVWKCVEGAKKRDTMAV